ncbi:MAG: COX15/CtaA family protein [Paracoccaceae bacterium]
MVKKGAVFEEVSGPRRQASAPARKGSAAGARTAIAAWLWGLAGLVAVMVLVGGLTRLTDSGLSITVWDPVMGAIPPLSQSGWEEAFAAYKTTTEFQVQNSAMTLAEFKPIYWWEWGHRFLGRVIGLVWAVGLGVFLWRRMVPPGWTPWLVVPGVLGGVQGAVGWWMVSSGLVGRLDVASYRLAVHLGLAFAILALLVWLARRIRLPEAEAMQARRRRAGGLGLVAGFGALAFLQIETGALVAGIDAGRYYPEWPLMAGQFFPPDALSLEPVWRNLFENAGLVQFVHRMLAYALVGFGAYVAWRLWKRAEPVVRWHGLALGATVFAQTVIGIWTAVNAAPLEIAIWHQAGALVVAVVTVSTAFALAYPPAKRLRPATA